MWLTYPRWRQATVVVPRHLLGTVFRFPVLESYQTRIFRPVSGSMNTSPVA